MVDQKTGFFDGTALGPSASIGREITFENFIRDVEKGYSIDSALERSSILRNSLPPKKAVELLLEQSNDSSIVNEFADKYFGGDMNIVNRYLGLK